MQVRIEDEDVVYEFEGDLIAGPVSTRLDPRNRQRARWMEARLWRKPDNTYVFETVSISTVWHLPDGDSHVRKPVTVSPDQLPRKAVYCGVLPSRPGQERCPEMTLEESRARPLPLDEVVTEETQRRIWVCPDRDSVVARMTMAHHRSDGSKSAAVSGPMADLLDEAAENDPAFRTAGKPVVSL
jgi:hypothetical protein